MTVLLLCSVVFCLYSGESDDTGNSVTRSVAESSISLDDSKPSDVTSDADSTEDFTVDNNSGTFVFLKMILVLIIVVGLIFFVFFFIKKKTNIVKSDDDFLRRAAYINIAPGKTVEVITLIDKAYLIGVTEDNITLLGEIKDEELIKAMNITADKKNNVKKPSSFSEVLDTFLVKGNKNRSVFDDAELEVNNIGRKREKE